MSEKKIWQYLYEVIGNEYGVAGLMGNLYAESGLKPNNLQNSYARKFGMTDDEYTAAVDNGSYGLFITDSAGYGLAQWTYRTRKANLLNHAQNKGVSIANLQIQLEFLVKELQANFKTVWITLCNAETVREASDMVLMGFERPADQSETAKERRASYGQTYYDKYAGSEEKTVTIELKVLKNGSKGSQVENLQIMLNGKGYKGKNNAALAVDGVFGTNTLYAVKAFQRAEKLTVDGIAGQKTLTALYDGV